MLIDHSQHASSTTRAIAISVLGRGVSDRRRGTIAWIAALAITFIAALAASAPPVNAKVIDLSSPEAGISDPVAAMAPRHLDCASGQVDVNHASVEQISAALHINSPKALQAIVDGRPWLKPDDLISVPGVPVSARERLARDACATPTALPVATPMACETGTEKVDLQAASAATIADRLKLPDSVADDILGARPLSQNPEQVVTPRVPGLSGPKLAKLMDAICITPAPFLFERKTWRWAYPEHGAVVESDTDDRYALIVPPGATAGPTGAWGDVEPRPDFEGSLPVLAAHIHGEWTPEIAVKLPPAVPGETGSVIHDPANGGMRLSTHDDVVADGDSIVVAAQTLSEFTATTWDCQDQLNPICQTNRDDVPRAVDPQLLEATPRSSTRAVGPRSVCPSTNPFILSVGSLSSWLFCSAEDEGSSAAWTFENHATADFLGVGIITFFGPVFDAQTTGGSHRRELNENDSNTQGLVASIAGQLFAERYDLLPPGYNLVVDKERGSSPTFLQSNGDEWGTALMAAAAQALGYIDDALPGVGGKTVAAKVRAHLVDVVKGCLDRVANTAGGNALEWAQTVANCIVEGAPAILKAVWEPMDGRTTAARQLKSTASFFGRLLPFTKILDVAVSWAVAKFSEGEHTVSMEYRNAPPPAPPVFDGPTNPAGGPDGTIVTDSGTQILHAVGGTTAYISYDGVEAYGMLRSSDEYACFAARHKLRDWLPLDKVFNYHRAELAAPALCDESVPKRPLLPTNATNWILRESTGTAWFIDDRSQLRWIRNGGVYQCLAQKAYVLDLSPWSEITRFEASRYAGDAVCP